MVSYDIPRLLHFDGPSTRSDAVGDTWVTILDYSNTDANERAASILLSSQGIPFRIDRPVAGWSQPKVRLYITVPRERLDKATALLAAGAEQSALDRIEGSKGLPGFPDGD